MLMQTLSGMIEEEPYLSAMATVDRRKYIVSKWNASHTEPMDEGAAALFLCDEKCGALTDEQRAFVKECRAEFDHCNQITVYRMLQCGEMMRRHLVSGPEEYCRIFLTPREVPHTRKIPLCSSL